MATLGDLQRSIFPTARPVAPESSTGRPTGATAPRSSGKSAPGLDPERAERTVGWVRVLKARVPAFDALEASDLAIIPGPSLAIVAPGAAQIDELAAALARSRVPAVLLVEGDGGAAALDALGHVSAGLGLTVLRVERVDPVALERSVIGFLVNRRAELDRRAAELESQLSKLALLGKGLDGLAQAIAAFVGRAVVIEGRRGDPIVVHAPADVPASAAAVTGYLARPADVALRIPIPAPAGDDGAGGRLVLLGDDAPGELERIVAERVTAVLALELARDAAVRSAREASRRDPLPADGPPWVLLLARQGGILDGEAGGSAEVIAGRDAKRAELRSLLSPKRVTLRGTSESLELRLVAAAPDDDPDGRAIAERVAGFLGRTVAVSRPFSEASGRPAAEAAARTTLEAAEALHDPPRIARAELVSAYHLLGNLHNLPDGLRQAQDLLAPILSGAVATRQARLATLRAVLETASLGEAAARLGVHRNTVAYRMARIERLGGWDMADADLRFALEVAVRIVQDAQ